MRALFESRKFKAAVAAALTAVAGGLTGAMGWDKVVMAIVGALVSYVAAQGLADIGKEKAKIERDE